MPLPTPPPRRKAQKANRERIIRLQQPRTGSLAAIKPADDAPIVERLDAQQATGRRR